MLCKVCNTRIGPGRSTCPNCGSHSISASPSGDPESTAKLPHLDIEDDSIQPGTDDAATVDLDEAAEIDVEVDVALDVESDEPSEVDLNEPAEVELDVSAPLEEGTVQEEKDDPPPAETASQMRRPRPFGSPDPAGLRAMLVENPELLEPGLSVYKNEKGTPLGAGYTSAVGEIDLLARDADGCFVIVMVAEPHEGEDLVSGVLQRIGWVRTHLGGKSQRVRGIVLMDHVRESIVYAAAAVADTVMFKTYQVALTFNDLEF